MSDKKVEIIKHIQQTGRCPEDDILTTSECHCSGHRPKSDVKFNPKKSINTNPPHVSISNKETTKDIIQEHDHNYVDISAYANPDIDYSNSLFDPNEKDPVMRALNMVKEYCNVSIRRITQHKNITTDCFKVEAYQDIINFIEDHQKKCNTLKDSVVEASKLKHIQNEAGWYKKRMEEYRKSFFMVCDLIKSSNVSESIKHFVGLEEKRY